MKEDVASVYAEAITAAAIVHQALDSVYSDFELIDACCRQEPLFVIRLAMPSLSIPQKIKVFEKAFGPEVTPLTMRFLHLLVRRGRVKLLPELFDAICRERDRVEGGVGGNGYKRTSSFRGREK